MSSTSKFFKLTDIIDDVKITIDEKRKNDAEFDSDPDNQDMDEIIKSKIPDALQFVYANADWSLLEPNKVYSSSDTSASNPCSVTDEAVGLCNLDKGFIRLVYAKFASWNRYVGHQELILWDDPSYAMLADKYITGTPQRPKVALAWGTSGKRLELYTGSSSTDTFIIGAMIMPNLETETSGTDQGYYIPDKCYRAVVYYVAGLTMITYRDQASASMMFQEASDLIGFTQQIAQREALQQQQVEQ